MSVISIDICSWVCVCNSFCSPIVVLTQVKTRVRAAAASYVVNVAVLAENVLRLIGI